MRDSPTRELRQTSRYRWGVVSRIVAAALGGYVLASAFIVFLSLVLPGPRPDAVLGAGILAFLVYAVAVIWVFAVKTATRAWIGVTVVSVVLGLASWLLKGGVG